MKYSYERVKEIVKNNIKVDSVKFLGSGNHSEAFLINDEIVVKLPKFKKASDCLETEIRVLQGLNNLSNKLNLEIPNILFKGEFIEKGHKFNYFASKFVSGKRLSKKEFTALLDEILDKNAEIIAKFLFILHNQRHILKIKRKDLCLLHGDFSLNHLRFNDNGIVCGVIDFGDGKIGKSNSDFIYLLDDEDDEEFGKDFGLKVLVKYSVIKLKDELWGNNGN